jgi:SAM-dependent methyltransferase
MPSAPALPLAASRTWLDVCCGAGSLLKFVCESGFSAVGLDISRDQLRYARKNAPSAAVVRADVRTFSLRRKFDVITCMFDSLNYLTEKKDLKRAFRAVRRHLNADGLFIFDVNTFDGLQDQWCRASVVRGTKCVAIIETSFDAKKALGRCLITGFIKEGRRYRRFEEAHIERGYRPREIEDLLARVGFAFKKYDGNSLSRAKKRAARLLYLCTQAGRERCTGRENKLI